MGEEKDIVMARSRREILLSSLRKGQRFEDRALDAYRPIEIYKGVIPNAEGSALVKLGTTQVLVGIKFDVATPFADRPNEGVLVTNAELLPLASSVFEPGPPDENSIELARVVDRGVRSAETVDLNSFFIEDGKVLAMYTDIYVLDHAGNFLDAAALAATAALTSARFPKVENNKVIRGESVGPLPLRAKPIATTMTRTGEYWLVDPLREEEQAADARITITTTETQVCAIQKGKGLISREDLLYNLEIAFKRGAELRSLL